jgi:hypothetical protein
MPVITPIHERLIQRREIGKAALSKVILDKIKMWNVLNAKKEKTEKLEITLRKKSVEISDLILNHIESDFPEEYATEINKEFKKAQSVDNNPENSDGGVEGFRAGLKKNKELTEQERAIVSELSDEKTIHYLALERILGKSVGFTVKTNNLILHNKVFTNYYELES